jgi:hypothetical protein
VVKGTAADVFNRAAVRVARAVEAGGLSAAVAFLLFDELWVECEPADVSRVEALIRAELAADAAADGLTIPVRIEVGDGPGRPTEGTGRSSEQVAVAPPEPPGEGSVRWPDRVPRDLERTHENHGPDAIGDGGARPDPAPTGDGPAGPGAADADARGDREIIEI